MRHLYFFILHLIARLVWFVFQKHGLLIVRFAMIRTFSEKTTPRKRRYQVRESGRGGGISIFVLKEVYFKLLTELSANGTIIQTKITCKKIPCYMCDSACRWFIVKKTKIFWTHIKHFWIISGKRKSRILNGLCKKDFLNCPTIFLNWHKKTKLLSASFSLER